MFTYSSFASTLTNSALPKWQVGAGLFYGSIPHYPASNHRYLIITPTPLFIYRFKKVTLEQREIGIDISETFRLNLTFGFSPPVGGNTRSAAEFSKESADPSKEVFTQDNFHRRGMDAIPPLLKLGAQVVYHAHPHIDISLPLFLNLGIDKIAYQGYEVHPEIEFSLQPHAKQRERFNLESAIEIRYGSQHVSDLYYQVNPKEVITGREAYDAKDGELSRLFRLTLTYRHQFNYNNSIRWFMGLVHSDYSHSANVNSPLHIVNESTALYIGLGYYFYSSQSKVNQ